MRNSFVRGLAVALCTAISISCMGASQVYAEEIVETVESFEGIETESNLETMPKTEEWLTEETILETESIQALENESESEMKSETEWESEEDLSLHPQEYHENSWRYEDGYWLGGMTMFALEGIENPWTYKNGVFINNYGEPIVGAKAKGIDVSSFNGQIDWDTVKRESDISYAIIRCGYGSDFTTQDDARWQYNVSECVRLDIPFGVYLYSYATNVEEAKSEAKHVLRLIEGYSLTYPVYLDLEDDRTTGTLTTKEIGDIADVFCDTIEDAGYEVGIYANLYWLNNILTDSRFGQWNKWVAQYNDVCNYTGAYEMWQCTSSGIVPGIEGRVDVNFDFLGRSSIKPGNSSGENTKLDGFVKRGNDTFYYKDDKMLKGSQEIDGKQYYFDVNTGAMFTGERVENGHWVYYGSNGTKAFGWAKHHGNQYYYDSKGWMMYGRQTIDGKQYIFNDVTGVLLTNMERVEGGHWVYYGNDGAKAIGWTKHHGNQYYYDSKGWMVYGRQWIDGKQYIFNDVTGVLLTNMERVEGGHWVYYGNNGAKAIGWTEHHGNQYYYDSRGWMVYGRQTIGGKTYTFDSVTGVLLVNAERVESGHWVYYGSDATKVTGWAKHHGNQYYYNSKGWMLYGNQTIDGKKYYFDKITGVMAKDMERVEGGHWVYYGLDGVKAVGWTEHHGHKYYYDVTGWMMYGRQTIDGRTYFFDSVTGVLLD